MVCGGVAINNIPVGACYSDYGLFTAYEIEWYQIKMTGVLVLELLNDLSEGNAHLLVLAP